MTAARSPYTERSYLTGVQYADDRNLAARQAIYRYQDERLDIYGFALDLLDLTGDERIVDVGCGNGRYLSALRRRGHRGTLVGVDLSRGMLAAARVESAGQASLVNADATSLPLATRGADAVLSMHMLYHVPDRAGAIRELRRVLRPGGKALVMTNAAQHLRQLREVIDAALADVTGRARWPETSVLTADTPFKLENGVSELQAVFGEVAVHRADRVLRVPEVEPIVAYAGSIHSMQPPDTDPVQVGAVLDRVAARTQAIIDASGYFEISTSVGCCVCH